MAKSAPLKRRGPKFTVAREERQQRFHLIYLAVDTVGKVVGSLIKWGAILGIFYCLRLVVSDLAGKVTVVDGSLTGNLNGGVKLFVNEHVAEILLAGVSIVTGGALVHERKANKKLRAQNASKRHNQGGGRHAA